MNLPAKTALSTAGILLVVAGAAGCGGNSGSKASGGSTSSSAPTGVSQTTFCAAFSTFEKDLAGIDPSGETTDIVKTFKSEAAKLHAVGTPTNITADEKSGFDAVIGAIEGLSDNASLQDLSNLDGTLTTAQKTDAQSFQTYLGTECPSLGAGTSTSSGSGSASPGTSATPSPSAS